MKRTLLFSMVVLLVNMGVDSQSGTMCGTGMGGMTSLLDGGAVPDGDAPDGGGGMPDGGLMPDGGGMGGGSGKVPHLINTETGEDLGVLVDLKTLTVFSEKTNALITLGEFAPPRDSTPFHYPELNCMGKPLIILGPSPNPPITNLFWLAAQTGTYLRPVGTYLSGSVVKSYRGRKNPDVDGMTICTNISPSIRNDLVDYADSGIKLRPTDDKLRVELR